MQNKLVGILVCARSGRPPFADHTAHRQFARAGAKMGLNVFVFSPAWVAWRARKTWGYTWHAGRGEWVKGVFPLPALIYDRYFYTQKRHLSEKRAFMKRLQHIPASRMLGGSVLNKWEMHQLLKRSPEISLYLPETALYRTSDTLHSWFVRHNGLFLKPLAGCQGKGVIHMIKTSGGLIRIRGRDSHNHPLHTLIKDERHLHYWLRRFIKQRRYLLQPALALHTEQGIPFDVRALVQKNGRGTWQTTGTAVRLGRAGSVTSNLHGGGTARQTETFLRMQFGTERGEQIRDRIRLLCERIPPYLEQYCGRLVELGLDFGVDRSGDVWILEVNSKPGRTAFAGQKMIRTAVYRQPLSYALHLLERQ